jgi:hypothetical protein
LNSEDSVDVPVPPPPLVGAAELPGKKGEEALDVRMPGLKPRGRVLVRESEVLREDEVKEFVCGSAERAGGGKKESSDAGTRRISDGGGDLGEDGLSVISSTLVGGLSAAAEGDSGDGTSGRSGRRSFICADLSRGMYNILRRWMVSWLQSLFAFRSSARETPYFNATPDKVSEGSTWTW